jgi:choline-sulfatase
MSSIHGLRVAVVFALAGTLAGACGRRDDADDAPRGRPDLLLVTIDTLRADRVGRGLTPTLDALAARGVQFTQARAAAPLTLPSHVSMLTGALPPTHGVRENGTQVFTGTPPPVARQLKNAGYRTAAFVGAYVLDRRFGLADGFDQYDDQIARDPTAVLRLEAERPANEVVDRAARWLRVRPASDPGRPGVGSGSDQGRTRVGSGSDQGRPGVGPGSDPGRTGVGLDSDPIFMWVHLYDPHAPYAGSYDQEVTFADAQVGRLLQEWRTAGRDPIVIIAGDHGESLGDHGERTHGLLLYEAALRVPLIVAGPGIFPARRPEPVSLVDIAPTLLTLGRSHRSDRSLIDPASTPDGSREIYSETEYPRVAGWSPVYALVQDRWKLIVSRGSELYDLATDPNESMNVSAMRQPLVSAMAARLEALRSSSASAPRHSASPDVAERLRALGYVAGSSAPPKPGDGPNPAEHIEAWGEFETALTETASDDRISALRRLKKLAEQYPDARVFQSTYARLLAETGSVPAALRVYRRAVERWPDDATLFHELAVAARDAERADEALKAEQAAIALEPVFPAAHNGIGLLMTDLGRHAEAAASFEAAAKADPTNAEYWVNVGNARGASGDRIRAGAAYRRAAELNPRSADAANGLGVLLVQDRRPADAIPWFERALQVAPDLVQARLNLGIAYQEVGQRDRAAQAYREVLSRARSGSAERRAASDLLRSLPR